MIRFGSKTIECVGVCFLQFNDDGLIERNEVYFDRTILAPLWGMVQDKQHAVRRQA